MPKAKLGMTPLGLYRNRKVIRYTPPTRSKSQTEKGLKMNNRKIIYQKTIAHKTNKSVLLVLIMAGLAGIAPWMIAALGQYVGAL
jgi:hypothetical protein